MTVFPAENQPVTKSHFSYTNTLYASRKMKTKIQILIIILFCGIIGCVSENDKQKYAEMIIEKVENFKNENSHLPKNVSEIGLTESEKSFAFYQKETDSSFTVWYGLGVGESNIYLSSTKKWTIGK